MWLSCKRLMLHRLLSVIWASNLVMKCRQSKDFPALRRNDHGKVCKPDTL